MEPKSTGNFPARFFIGMIGLMSWTLVISGCISFTGAGQLYDPNNMYDSENAMIILKISADTVWAQTHTQVSRVYLVGESGIEVKLMAAGNVFFALDMMPGTYRVSRIFVDMDKSSMHSNISLSGTVDLSREKPIMFEEVATVNPDEVEVPVSNFSKVILAPGTVTNLGKVHISYGDLIEEFDPYDEEIMLRQYFSDAMIHLQPGSERSRYRLQRNFSHEYPESPWLSLPWVPE